MRTKDTFLNLNKWICIIVCAFIFESCTVASFVRYMGTTEPVQKNEDEIYNYLKEEDFLFYDYSFILPKHKRDTFSLPPHHLDLWKYERKVGQSPIQLRIYDSVGNFVNGYCQCYGEIKIVNILAKKDFKFFPQFPNNHDLKFSDELVLWDVPSNEQLLFENSNKKYTFVIYWNIWSNYYSKIIFKKLKKYLKKYDMRDDALIIIVNTDNISF